MASIHHTVTSGKKGSAANHSRYIGRQGQYSRRGDLISGGHGNMPAWAQEDPRLFWKRGDKHERVNGAVYREHVIALPNELTRQQQTDLASELVRELAAKKPFQFAVHAPEPKLGKEPNVHLHLMFSDRIDDGIERTPAQTFSRYNAKSPELGGRQKGSGGMNRLELRDQLIETRRKCADIQNAALARAGQTSRVDHRTLRQQGSDRQAERHLGAARINRMSDDDKAQFVSQRTT